MNTTTRFLNSIGGKSLVAMLIIALASPALQAQTTFSHDTGTCSGITPLTSVAAGGDLRTEDAPFSPVVVISHVDLGLDPDDNIDAISFGDDKAIGRPHVIVFSIDPASHGVAGTGTWFETFTGTSGLAPEACGDIFIQRPGNTNVLAPAGRGYDDGTLTGDQDNASWQAPNAGGTADDLDAFDYSHGEDMPGVYFSLACGSPSLAVLGMSPGDILYSNLSGNPPIVATLAGAGPANALNLGIPGEDLDALNLIQAPGNPGVIRPGLVGPTPGSTGVMSTHRLEFSVAPGGAFNPADVLVRVAMGAAAVSTPDVAMGLTAEDDLNALESIRVRPNQVPGGFMPDDGVMNPGG